MNPLSPFGPYHCSPACIHPLNISRGRPRNLIFRQMPGRHGQLMGGERLVPGPNCGSLFPEFAGIAPRTNFSFDWPAPPISAEGGDAQCGAGPEKQNLAGEAGFEPAFSSFVARRVVRFPTRPWRARRDSNPRSLRRQRSGDSTPLRAQKADKMVESASPMTG